MISSPRISILGAGWLGLNLAKYFSTIGYRVLVSSRSEKKLNDFNLMGLEGHYFDLDRPNFSAELKDSPLFNADIIIICISSDINEVKNESYWLEKFKYLFEYIQDKKVDKVFLMSSIGVIPDVEKQVDEESATNTPLKPSYSLYAEQALTNFDKLPAYILRLGGLIGPGRDLGKHFAGKQEIPNGLNPVNLIHVNDICAILKWMIENPLNHKVWHLVNPEHPTRAEHYTNICELMGQDKPTFKLEKSNWKEVNSKYVNQFHTFQINLNQLNINDFTV